MTTEKKPYITWIDFADILDNISNPIKEQTSTVIETTTTKARLG